jgi:hypothetical protein
VKLQKGVLNCSKRVNGEEKQLKITPTAKQWAEFRRSLDQAGVWQWRTNYQNPSVMDGTAWSLKIEYTSRSVHASGVNRYPDERGKPGEGSDYTKAFDAYVTALHTLTESKFLK